VKLRVLAEAEAELHEAVRYYEDRQTGLGEDFYQRVVTCMDSIRENPLRFPMYEGLGRTIEYRRARVERFPYIVLYKVIADATVVIAVAHTSRRPGYWQDRA
jgi:toxin ParE1/3/4